MFIYNLLVRQFLLMLAEEIGYNISNISLSR